MDSFNKSFVTELTKIAQSGSSTSNLAKLLALGGLGYGGYKMYQANQANKAQVAEMRALGNLGYQLATAAQAARSARNARNKRLLGLGLGAGALGAAHHFGLDSSILEKVKGLFGGGAAEAANPLVSAAKGGSKLFSAILDKAKAGHFTSPNYAEMPAVPKAIQLGADGIKYHGETGDVFFPQKGLNPGAGIPGMPQYYYGADPSNPLMPSETQIEAGNKFLLNPKNPITSDSRWRQYERLTNPGLMGTLKNLFGVKPEALIR
jgi:hypothetical protein